MIELDPGHIYHLATLDGPEGACEMPERHSLQFVKRTGPNYPGNKNGHHGTTLQEVLRACCSRLRYVNKQGAQLNQKECPISEEALSHLRQAILLLEVRAAQRHGRSSSELTADMTEFGSCCNKCNHVGCEGECHKNAQ